MIVLGVDRRRMRPQLGDHAAIVRIGHAIERAYTRIVRNALFMGAHYTEEQA